jgi:hypothetical protein
MSAARKQDMLHQPPILNSEMIKAINGWLLRLGERQTAQRVIIDLATIIAILRHANQIESGHGSITLTIKNNRFHSISHEETELLPQTKLPDLG